MPLPQPRALFSDEVVNALRGALQRRLMDERHDGDLRAALHRVSGEAHTRGLHGEHVVLVLKQVWGELSGTALHLAPEDRQLMLERLVTLCLDQYYEEQ